MGGDDEHDDEQASGLPPHPLDRTWFHPSELHAALGAEPPAPARSRQREWSIAGLAALAGVVATVGVLAVTGAFRGTGTNLASSALATVTSGFGRGAIAEIVDESTPSVVAVRVVAGDATAPRTASGIVVSGVEVLTTAGAVAGATAVTVAVAGHVFSAAVVGSDAETDTALLRVKDADLQPPRFGSGDGLRVGQAVLALGMSNGDHQWAATGIVNAVDRVVDTQGGIAIPGLVQTDLQPAGPVSGGALLDADGAVVGMLTGAAPGHALPIEWARDVVEQLSAGGRVRHGWLGLTTVDADDRPGGGARVTVIASDGPAAAAGVVAGDVVTSLAGDRVTDMADLVAASARRRPGDPVTLVLWRHGDRVRAEVTLAERPAA